MSVKGKVAIFGLAIGITVFWLGNQVGSAFGTGRAQQKFHQSYPLTTNGKFRLDNVNGKVQITAWDRPEVMVDAIKRGGREADMEAVKIQISSEPDEIRIHTKYPQTKWGFWTRGNSTRVEFDIKVPAAAQLSGVENVNGSVEIRGVRGSVKSSTVNGRLHVEGLVADAQLGSVNGTIQAVFGSLKNVKLASLKTVNGRVTVTLPNQINADFSAHTVNGGIHSMADLPPKKNWPVGTELHGTLGAGGTKIRAETVNGPIYFQRAEPTAPSGTQKPQPLEQEEQKCSPGYRK